jgi:ubiquinone/menaquinone biosynthesis C-methylase UbiE
VGNAEDQKLLSGKTFDVVTVVLALQNMKNLDAAVKNMSRLLSPKGKVVLVLNHPAFRVPKKSAWGIDEDTKTQYRRVDAYMSDFEAKMDMTPGKKTNKEITMTYHRPLQTYTKAFAKESLAIVKMEEWISHRTSVGTHAKMENSARKEIPLFMCLVLKKI